MKKIISFLMVFVLCLSFCVVPFDANAADISDGLQKLYALGILDSATDDLSRPVTRIEMVKYAARLYGPDVVLTNSETRFADVPKEHEASGIVNFAEAKGIISPSAMFYPERTIKYEEALKMVVTALEYGEIASLKGGYPGGYISVASSIGLLDNVVAGEGNGLTLITAVTILENALSSSVCDASLIINKDGTSEYLFSDSAGETVLNKRFGVSRYEAFITDVKASVVKADILAKDKKDTIALYNQGDSVTLPVSQRALTGDIKFTYADIYVNGDDEVVFAEPDRNTSIVTGYIYEVNEVHNTAEIYPSYIENIGFENTDDYLDVADSCIMLFDGEAVSQGSAYPYTGAFARAVIYNDEIIALEAWSLTEGGIITKVGENDIEYIKGETPVAILSDITSYEDVTIFINGIKSELWALVTGTLFDWYASSDKENLLIVASTREITDTFDSVSQNGLKIGGDLYPLSEMYNVYYALEEENYRVNADVYNLLGRTVTAYIDFAGYIRYVRPVLDDELNKEYYAFVVGYDKQGLADPQLQVYTIDGSAAQKNTYNLTENVAKNQSLLIENIESEMELVTKADESQKNEVLKHRELIYKIRVNDKGQITSLRPATKFSEPILNERYAAGYTGYSASAFPGDARANTVNSRTASNPNINGPLKLYFEDAVICALYYDEDDGITLKTVTWDKLKARGADTNAIWLTPFAEAGSSDVELMLIRGDVKSIRYTREDYSKRGFTNEIYTGYDAQNEREVTNVVIDGKTYTVSEDIDMLNGVTDAAYFIYSTDNPFLPDDEIKFYQDRVYNLSGSPDTWVDTSDVIGVNGLHKDEIEKIDSKRAYFTSGEAWYMGETVPVYEVIEQGDTVKFIESHRGSVPEGVDAWYVIDLYEIRALFFRR